MKDRAKEGSIAADCSCRTGLNELANRVQDTVRNQPLGPYPRRAYVIELEVPRHESSCGCVYVGESYLPAEVRLEQHRDGVHSSADVRRFGVMTRPDLYEMLPPVPPRFARPLESALGRVLRECGFCVHGAH